MGAAIGSSIKSVIFQAREKVGQRQGGWTLMKSPAVPRVAWPSCAAVRDGGRVVVGFQEENPAVSAVTKWWMVLGLGRSPRWDHQVDLSRTKGGPASIQRGYLF